MTTPEEQMRLWRGATNAERHALYYSHRANIMQRWDTGISILVLVASSSSVVSLVTAVLPGWVSVILIALAGVATIIDMKIGFSRQATNSLWIKNECRALANQWDRLWVKRNSPCVMDSVDDLEKRLEYVTREEVSVHQRWNQRFTEDAFDVVRARLTPTEKREHREKPKRGIWSIFSWKRATV